MLWKDYSQLRGTHAFLSPSKYHWLNYDSEKLVQSYINHRRVGLGTQYHALAEQLIKLAVRLPNTDASLNAFVNDAIGFRMDPEILLYYTQRCFGTADAISFENGVLRIHDLKTGVSPGSINQLLVYAGLFCLDYAVEAKELEEVHLKIYQNSETVVFSPSPEEVFDTVFRIKEADKTIEAIELGSI